MAINYYKWDDSSAPTLSGTVGDMINLLDKCLVDGYGAKAPAGWIKEFSNTNRAAYRAGAGQAYYRFCDSAADESIGTAPINGENCTMRAFTSMTDVDTGLGMFPTVAQIPYYGVKKSSIADAVTKEWILVEDNGLVYFSVKQHGTTGVGYPGLTVFGKFKSTVPGDTYNYCIGASNSNNTTYSSSVWPTVDDVLYAARAHDGIVESKGMKMSFFSKLYTGNVSNYGFNNANEFDGSVTLIPFFLYEESESGVRYSIRGSFPGLFTQFEYMGLDNHTFDTFSSKDSTIDYTQCKHYTSSSLTIGFNIQTNDTWEW